MAGGRLRWRRWGSSRAARNDAWDTPLVDGKKLVLIIVGGALLTVLVFQALNQFT